MPPSRLALAAAIALPALASLLLPYAPVYDAWAWLIWGREVGDLALDTSGGPSWKPLPVAVATLLAPLGDAAPDAWLFIARVGWLAAAALAWSLASRLLFAPGLRTRIGDALLARRMDRARLAAGAIAAAGVVLLADPFTPWVTQFAGGLSEPLLVALTLGATDRELAGRPGQALALALAASLLRPEAWPFAAAYAAFAWRRAPRLRGPIAAGVVAVPVLWLVPDLLGSGDALTGAGRAREGSGSPPGEALEALGRAFELVLVALWASAAHAVQTAWRARERPILILASGVLAWFAVVAILAAAGYAGIPRFAAPAAALACVLGAVGAVRLAVVALGSAPATRRRTLPLLALITIAGAGAGQGVVRLADLPGQLDEAAAHGTSVERLFAVAESVGIESIRACGPASTSDFLTETALAWKLELPMADLGRRVASAPPAGTAFLDADAPAPAREAVRAAGRELAREGHWRFYVISCEQPLRTVTGDARAPSSGKPSSAPY